MQWISVQIKAFQGSPNHKRPLKASENLFLNATDFPEI
jgi:hypothetical protein